MCMKPAETAAVGGGNSGVMMIQMHTHTEIKKAAGGGRPGPFTLTGVQHWLAPLKNIHFLSNWTSAQFNWAILADGLVNTWPCVPEEKL